LQLSIFARPPRALCVKAVIRTP